jgi:hypothetical protein
LFHQDQRNSREKLQSPSAEGGQLVDSSAQRTGSEDPLRWSPAATRLSPLTSIVAELAARKLSDEK